MFKRLLAIAAGLMVGLSIYAADTVLRDDHPTTYVVQRGDTLWDIAGRFLKRPWVWPEIWQANPQIVNPHLIYPGDVINLAYLNGVPALETEGGPRARVIEEAIPTIPLSDIEPFLNEYHLFHTRADMDARPYVVAVEENRLRGIPGQVVYVRNIGGFQPGDRVSLARPTLVYRELPEWRETWNSYREYDGSKTLRAKEWDLSTTLVPGVWRDSADSINHHNARLLGYEVRETATGTVLRLGDPATVLLEEAEAEVKKGDILLPVDNAPFDLYFFPRAPKSVPNNMRIMAIADALHFGGSRYVVALSRGARDGVENGEVYAMFQPGAEIRDDVKYRKTSVYGAMTKFEHARVELPAEFEAHVMIFRTFDDMSYGLVMEGIRPVTVGAISRAPLNY